MADDWAVATADELERWAGKHEGAVDPHGGRLLLDLAREELHLTSPGELTPDRLRELLLETFPEVVVAGVEEVPAILATVGGLIDFLGDTGVVPPAHAAELRAELGRLEPEFAEIVAEVDESERESAAEVIAGMMRLDGVTLGDQDAIEDWVRRFEALPEDERYAMTEDYLRQAEELMVPPVRLAPPDELAAAARRSGLSTQALALAAWTGEREVTGTGALALSDAVAAAGELGLATSRRSEPGATVDSLADLPELDRLWWAVIEAEMLVAHGSRVVPGPGLADLRAGDADAVLTAWLRLFDEAAVLAGEPEEHLDAFLLVRGELTGVLIHLYEQEQPSTRAELSEALSGHILDLHDDCEHELTAEDIAAALDLELDDLTAWGVLEPVDGGHVLTPLGVWGVRELLVADGFSAPVVGDLTGVPAADLVAGLVWHREDTADEEIDRWLAARPAADAAADLVEVMHSGGPGDRNLAAAVLHRVDASAAPVVRPALEDAAVRPYAALWLRAHGDETVELDQAEMVWVFVDTLAGLLETAEPAVAVATALADAPPDADLDGLVEDMWRVDHPDVADVLDALGEHHPDKKLAKTARKAAYKARSRHGGS